MFRAMFFACAVFIMLCGGLLLFVDRVVLTDYAGRKLRESDAPVIASSSQVSLSQWRLVSSVSNPDDVTAGREVIDPPDWAAFALLSAGGVTLLYTLALPGQRDDDEE